MMGSMLSIAKWCCGQEMHCLVLIVLRVVAILLTLRFHVCLDLQCATLFSSFHLVKLKLTIWKK